MSDNWTNNTQKHCYCFLSVPLGLMIRLIQRWERESDEDQVISWSGTFLPRQSVSLLLQIGKKNWHWERSRPIDSEEWSLEEWMKIDLLPMMDDDDERRSRNWCWSCVHLCRRESNRIRMFRRDSPCSSSNTKRMNRFSLSVRERNERSISLVARYR